MNVVTNCSETILKMIAEVLELAEDQVSAEQSFLDIGMNSIGFINLIIKCETDFEVEFADDKFLLTNFPAISDFISYVEGLIG